MRFDVMRPMGVLVLLAAVGCGGGDGGTVGPTAGVFKVVLTTPNADDGALLLTVAGGPVTAVEPAAQYQVLTAQPDSLTTRVLVTGNIAAGEVLRLQVPDTRRLSAYRASLAQAASRATFAQQALTSYSLAITP